MTDKSAQEQREKKLKNNAATRAFAVTEDEDFCWKAAVNFIKVNGEKYPSGDWIGGATSPEVVTNQLLGAIAHEKYKECVGILSDKKSPNTR